MPPFTGSTFASLFWPITWLDRLTSGALFPPAAAASTAPPLCWVAHFASGWQFCKGAEGGGAFAPSADFRPSANWAGPVFVGLLSVSLFCSDSFALLKNVPSTTWSVLVKQFREVTWSLRHAASSRPRRAVPKASRPGPGPAPARAPCCPTWCPRRSCRRRCAVPTPRRRASGSAWMWTSSPGRSGRR